MPTAKIKNGREDTTLVFDTWAQIEDGALTVTWDADLSEPEARLLSDLAERLGYIGRSESWVLAQMAQSGDSLPADDDCLPCEVGAPQLGRGWEQIPLMAPMPAERYEQWRQAAIEAESATIAKVDLSKKKLSKEEKRAQSQLRQIEESYPRDLIDCLQSTTDWLRQLGWSQPPGSERVFYWRRTDALQVGAPTARPRATSVPVVEAMLLSMSSVSGNDHALPSVIRTLPQAELLHRALVSMATKGGLHSEALTGCDQEGKPLCGPHSHAHILPLDLDTDGHIDHVLIWAPAGLGGLEQATVRAIRRTFTKGGTSSLRLALAGMGSVSDMCNLPGVEGNVLRAVLGSPEGPRSSRWRSVTPFVPPRYLKNNGRNTLAGQVAAELASRGLPAPMEVRVIDPITDDEVRRHRHFVRRRQNGRPAPVDCGFTIELLFSSPVRGPICLGFGSHFGLGLFAQRGDTQQFL